MLMLDTRKHSLTAAFLFAHIHIMYINNYYF